MRRLLPHLLAIVAWLTLTGLISDAAFLPGTTIIQTPVIGGLNPADTRTNSTPLGSVDGEGLPGKPYGGVLSIQGEPLMQPLSITPSGPIPSVTTPSTANLVSGTANTTGATTVSLINPVPGKRIYVTAFSCANTGSTTSLISFQDGSGGATLWTSINPTVAGTNMAPSSPMFWTSPGNGLFFIEGSASTTAYCSASGFTG